MGDGRWIVIPRWEEHQHRDAARTSVPTWIKFFTRLLHDDAYLSLTAHQRAVLHGLWLEYASSRRQLPLSTASLSARLRLRVTTQQLEALNHAGFIGFSASKPASNHAGTDAGTEVEVEVEGPPYPLEEGEPEHAETATSRQLGMNPRAAGTNPRALDAARLADDERRRNERHARLLEQAWMIVADWNGGTSLDFDDRLDQLERDLNAHLTATERMRLWDNALTGL